MSFFNWRINPDVMMSRTEDMARGRITFHMGWQPRGEERIYSKALSFSRVEIERYVRWSRVDLEQYVTDMLTRSLDEYFSDSPIEAFKAVDDWYHAQSERP